MSDYQIPSANIEIFEKQVSNPNIEIMAPNNLGDIRKLTKNVVLSLVCDPAGCGHIRNIFPISYLNAEMGKTGNFNVILSSIPLFQPEVLARCRSVFFQRWFDPAHINIVKQYKEIQKKLKFRMVYDIDDFIWSGDDVGEHIPPYNFGSYNVGQPCADASIEIMNMMDVVCVSTDFLKSYLENKLKIKSNVVVVPNAVPKFFWNSEKKKPITERLECPKVIYTGSPTHYFNQKELSGDWENAWCEWVIKSVREKKIRFVCMGGLPFFFESIKNHDNFKIIKWVNSFHYHLPIMREHPDFGVAPLVPNYFNYSKSDIKHIEYCAAGALSIGTHFVNGKPSPYDNNFVKVPDDASIEYIDDIFNEYSDPVKYNEIINKQYDMLNINGRWLESPQNINRFISIF